MAKFNNIDANNWDFKYKRVDEASFVQNGMEGFNFVSSESILVAAGPPRLSQATGFNGILPIGVVQSVSVGQQKSIQQLFEIGSRRTIFVPGRTFVQGSISRIHYNGPSLMKAIYRFYGKDSTFINSLSPDDPMRKYSQVPIKIPAGHGDYYMNLASELFNRPFGLALIVHDSEDEPYGGIYLENCLIQSHNLGIGAGQTVIAENVSFRCDLIAPIELQAITTTEPELNG